MGGLSQTLFLLELVPYCVRWLFSLLECFFLTFFWWVCCPFLGCKSLLPPFVLWCGLFLEFTMLQPIF